MTRVVLFHGPNRPLEVRDIVAPPLADRQILVRVLACTICRSDLHTHAGRRPGPIPSILGHEIVGRIEAFGPGTSPVDFAGNRAAVDDRVTWSIAVGCGDCYFCQHDLPQKCVRLYKYGHEAVSAAQSLGGGLADHIVLIPNTAWLKIPDVIPTAVASLANCAGATAASALRAAGAVAGQRVLVLGAGVLGVFASAMARSAGAQLVVAVDPLDTCRERALQFGANAAHDAKQPDLVAALLATTDWLGFDVVLELAGVTSSVATAIAAVRTGGTAILVGSVAQCDSLPLDPEQLVRRMITLRGVHNYHPRDLQETLHFLSGAGRMFPFASLIAAEFGLEQAEKAFRVAHGQPGARVCVTSVR
ncbi:zinc-binding dehydrogenase [Lacipirellula limnantheis]|uniref:alcohol dehydrogenase n=1 Tax=Lacipirellula limnantheis TaxID=2528024 RepID=A0A517U099_9BACT|nr:zinc-binding dehydrogenase [Lacipirellula limnantheis]QDT74052.1 Alcohol dehydrogenase [Lacipirellula limnantheis]